MNPLDDDLDDTALFYKSSVQKRKATRNGNPKKPKQLKLQFQCKRTDECKDIEMVKNGNSRGEKTESTKSQDSDSKSNESKRSYFSTKKPTNTCPLCLKPFKSDLAYSAHMKQCAKTHKMTTQQLLQALELQKKQMKERRYLGLCSQRSLSPTKTISKKKKEKDAESCDLALGLALSRSLTTATTTEGQRPQQPSQTLQEFGFTSRNAGLSRKKNEIYKKTTLKERTAEERQKIIIEKVAMVLLDEYRSGEPDNTSKHNSELQNLKVPQLWNMAENNEKRSWYVPGIKTLVLPGEDSPEEITIQSENIDSDISKLNLPRSDLHKDWCKMINNRKFSDFTWETKDCLDVHLHSVVLFARCSEMLHKDCQSVFRKFNLSTILIFLEYVYCGTLNGLIRTEINNLLDLAIECNYDDLIAILNCLKDNLAAGSPAPIQNSPRNIENDALGLETDSKKRPVLEERDLFTDLVDLTKNDPESADEEGGNNSSGIESNLEKSYWSFVQLEKKKSAEKSAPGETNVPQPAEKLDEDEATVRTDLNKVNELQSLVDDSATRDFDDELGRTDARVNSSDCIILSSGSESRTQENLAKSRTPSPFSVNFEVPKIDPYDNFHVFSEEPLSPVPGVHSQSLISGDISMASRKSPDAPEDRPPDDSGQEETRNTVGYCSTPVTCHQQFSTKKSAPKHSPGRIGKRKRSDLSASRIIRKSLGLEQRNPGSSAKLNRKIERGGRNLAEALTNSILNEMSKSSVFQSSPPARRKMFVEMTPISSREELADDATPTPNYSNMGETLLKEQLRKYGLKRNLAKSKAKKILRYIYDELHPLYNTETGKIVKMLPGNTPQVASKKSKSDRCNNAKSKRGKNSASGKSKQTGKKRKNSSNSSKESAETTDGSIRSFGSLSDYDSDNSGFESLSETLTQSTPSNPIDLSLAFCDFLQINPSYHQRILLYEPIWLEELQKNLKETFGKHFKMSDIMDFLDHKCITFRSEARAKKLKQKNEKKKENSKKKKIHSS